MIELEHLSKTYVTGQGTVEALRDVSLTLTDGDIFGIIGMSGAGKSTLVRCLNLLERPTGGRILLDGRDLCRLNQKELRQVRRQMSMIFQGFNLLAQRTCLGNVCFPLELAGVPKARARAKARELLELVGLPDKADAWPAQLSGGQQQRVAIARALATEPRVLICDEATSALDPDTTRAILELLRDIHRRLGITMVFITHQMEVVEAICHHVAILDQGQVAECGEVAQIFSQPRTQAARRLVYPQGAQEILTPQPGEHLLRVVFRGAPTTRTPLIAQMAMERHIAANILSASTRSIGEKVYGNMLLSIPGDHRELAEARAWLERVPQIQVQEVS